MTLIHHPSLKKYQLHIKSHFARDKFFPVSRHYFHSSFFSVPFECDFAYFSNINYILKHTFASFVHSIIHLSLPMQSPVFTLNSESPSAFEILSSEPLHSPEIQ